MDIVPPSFFCIFSRACVCVCVRACGYIYIKSGGGGDYACADYWIGATTDSLTMDGGRLCDMGDYIIM